MGRKRKWRDRANRFSAQTKFVAGVICIGAAVLYILFGVQSSFVINNTLDQISRVLDGVTASQAQGINSLFEEIDHLVDLLKNDEKLQKILLEGCWSQEDEDYLRGLIRLHEKDYLKLEFFASSSFYLAPYGIELEGVTPYVGEEMAPNGFTEGIRTSFKRRSVMTDHGLEIRSQYTFQQQEGLDYGGFSIDLQETHLFRTISMLMSATDSYYLINNQNVVVSATKRLLVGKQLEDETIYGMIVDKKNAISTKERRLIKNQLAEKQWYLLKDIDMKTYVSQAENVRAISVWLFVVVFGIMICLGVVYTRQNSKRMRALAMAMYNDLPYNGKIVDKGAPDRFFDSTDDMTCLIRGYTMLRQKMEALIEEVYLTENARINLKLRTLQEQINPHFLYNTLNSIKCCLELNKTEDTKQMLMDLSKFYRKSLSGGQEKITIASELEMLNCYTQLQKMCYGDFFDLVIDMPSYLDDFLILKFSMQPILENCLKYAFPDKKKRGVIRITGELYGDDILLSVADDGCGLPYEKQRAIRRGLASDIAGEEGGYGLKNVHARMRLNYGQGYGITGIESRPGIGTKIALHIPQEV